LRDQNGAVVVENDNWKTNQQQELETGGLQPTDELEAALVATIQPGHSLPNFAAKTTPVESASSRSSFFTSNVAGSLLLDVKMVAGQSG
jgi:UDP-glucose 4-epimerase